MKYGKKQNGRRLDFNKLCNIAGPRLHLANTVQLPVLLLPKRIFRWIELHERSTHIVYLCDQAWTGRMVHGAGVILFLSGVMPWFDIFRVFARLYSNKA